MGRPSEGWRVIWKRGYAYVRFTWDSHDHRIALRTKDKREAQEAAAREYAEVVSGRKRPIRRRPGKLLDLADLLDAWIETKRPTLHPLSVDDMLDIYARRYVDYFGSLERINESTGAAFGIALLGQMLRTTANRHLSYLREFLRWCRREGALAFVPDVPRLPPKAPGVRTGKHRAKAVDISPKEAAAILALLPVESKKLRGRKWPVRDRFAFTWETGFRPGTISRLSVPTNWRPGMKHVELLPLDDKARFAREVDLTPRALRILKRCAPAEGLVFGFANFSKAIKRAAVAVLGPVRGKSFAPYDFRHGRARERLDAGAPIRGVSYMLGHKRVSTTDKYLAPERSAGRAALAARRKTVSAPYLHRKKRRGARDAKNKGE